MHDHEVWELCIELLEAYDEGCPIPQPLLEKIKKILERQTED